ncbi:MAG: transcriptional regulator [Proteobacteria bacterium]|nr:transcriptional regulator [Pseudomonadota bacterium]
MGKFLLLALCAVGLYVLFKGDRRKKEMSSKQQSEKLKSTGDLIKDPECGSFVNKDGDIRVRSGDTVHVFCSYECREKYLKKLGVSIEQE